MEKYYSTSLYKPWWKRRVWKIIFVLVVILVIFLFYFAWLVFREVNRIQFGGASILNPEAAQLIQKEPLDQTTARRIVESLDDPFLGPENAKAVVVQFADFQCPYSQKSFLEVREAMLNYQDRVKFVFRDFPISTIHTEAQVAAQASECAHKQGKFWEMHDKIFLNQKNLSEEFLKNTATEIGLDMKQFERCLNAKETAKEVEEDLEAGIEARVVGTPTFFFNGIPWFGAMDKKQFELIIEKLLATTTE